MAELKQVIKVTKDQMETLINGGEIDGHKLSDEVFYAVEDEGESAQKYQHNLWFTNAYVGSYSNFAYTVKAEIINDNPEPMKAQDFYNYLRENGYTSESSVFQCVGVVFSKEFEPYVKPIFYANPSEFYFYLVASQVSGTPAAKNIFAYNSFAQINDTVIPL